VSTELDVQLAVISREVTRLAKAVEKIETNVKTMQEASNREERNRLVAGIGILGTVVMVFGGIIWTNFSHIIGR
jgi:hypothetical protein